MMIKDEKKNNPNYLLILAMFFSFYLFGSKLIITIISAWLAYRYGKKHLWTQFLIMLIWSLFGFSYTIISILSVIGYQLIYNKDLLFSYFKMLKTLINFEIKNKHPMTKYIVNGRYYYNNISNYFNKNKYILFITNKKEQISKYNNGKIYNGIKFLSNKINLMISYFILLIRTLFKRIPYLGKYSEILFENTESSYNRYVLLFNKLEEDNNNNNSNNNNSNNNSNSNNNMFDLLNNMNLDNIKPPSREEIEDLNKMMNELNSLMPNISAFQNTQAMGDFQGLLNMMNGNNNNRKRKGKRNIRK